jgi:hypothetical protein
MDNPHVLHWLPEEDRWELIGWEDWTAFRGIMAPSIGLPGIAGGIHYFIVCVHDDGTLVNLLPHKYVIELDGRIGPHNFPGLTREERLTYSQIMLARESNPKDKARLDEIRSKMWDVFLPPPESIPALRRALPKPPKAGSLAQQFMEEIP